MQSLKLGLARSVRTHQDIAKSQPKQDLFGSLLGLFLSTTNRLLTLCSTACSYAHNISIAIIIPISSVSS